MRTFTSSAAMYKYGWLTMVAGTSEGGRRHEDRLITVRRLAGMLVRRPGWIDTAGDSDLQAAAAAIIAAHCARQARSTARGPLWAQAAMLDTATLFGRFRIDPVTGAQVKHEAVLVRWTPGGLAPA